MINILWLLIIISIVKLLFTNNLLILLMVMELISMCTFFIILYSSPEIFGLGVPLSCYLTIQISESVLSISMFICLVRLSIKEEISALTMLKF